MDRIIVSRHPAAVQFIARQLGGEYISATRRVEFYIPCGSPGDPQPQGAISVVAEATPDNVRGKIVYGNLPMHLAALAAEVWAVEFDGAPPRGAEYTVADMERAGARLRRYVVLDSARVDLARAGHDVTV